MARAASICGTAWQDAYARLHAEATANATAGRHARILLFDTSGNGGLADRLTGMMTALLLAVLSDRALAIDWPGHELAFQMPRFGDGSNAHLVAHARATPANSMRRVEWLNKNRKQLLQLMTSDALRKVWPERVVALRSNRGFTQGLVNAPSLADAVAARGLTSRNAQFGCLFNFLLRPTEAVLEPLAPLLAAMRRPDSVTVGVHIRTGDSAFVDEPNADADAQRARGARLFAEHRFILEFADGLAARLAAAYSPPRTARLLLLGDSQSLRAHAAEVYGEKLLLSNASVGHVARQQTALLSAVGEHWLYGYAHAFAYSSHSGFPRTAAARAMRDDALHTCFHYTGPLFNKDQPTARECTGPYSIPELGERHAAGL